MGVIPSVSLPAGLTCRKDCECSNLCYAKKIERLRPVVKDAYYRNYELLQNEPERYWREVEAAIMMSRFFRFHVSGDIPDNVYLAHIIEIAGRNPHCEILCFTKRYDLVEEHMDFGGTIPKNLHIIFSVWRGLKCDNPYQFPEAHVRYKDGTTTASANAKECRGNCTECAITERGCWTLQRGEQIALLQH